LRLSTLINAETSAEVISTPRLIVVLAIVLVPCNLYPLV
jgi:hypothetical protein